MTRTARRGSEDNENAVALAFIELRQEVNYRNALDDVFYQKKEFNIIFFLITCVDQLLCLYLCISKNIMTYIAVYHIKK
jgi:hypothetical protein